MKKIAVIIAIITLIGIVLGLNISNNSKEVSGEENFNKVIENEDNGTNNIKENSYEILKVTETKEIKNDDGITIVNLEYSYPVIENEAEDEYIDYINKEYKLNADKFAKQAEETKEEAQNLYEEIEENFMPYARELSYEIHINKKGLLSITTIQYYNNSGAYGSFVKESKNFSVNQKEELSLSDIIDDTKWDFRENLYKLFKEKLEKDGLEFDEITEMTLSEELGSVQYYIKDGAVVLYFNADQVAPHALGEPTIEIPYNEEMFLIKI